ncbi:hypothetical protein GGS23DRAFT_592922 [Durotheca rogersii]|uniref:uncharacterized protein n=1 Tax=Durotheca rogersii TaxID=419775 RepID=UPI0022201048|nr:uncharacterized protein GGS23DRAFT_592922 [Durotheca rogersii]KAI5867622.1 hypothetical protein GGS23DRAFT_592922 [Durotheca rogersii]
MFDCSDAEVSSPLPGPSKTFSIEFAMPVEGDPRDNFKMLREKHEHYLDTLVPSTPGPGDDPAMSSPSARGAFSFNNLSIPTPSSTTTTSSVRSRPMTSLGIKPQFNLDSAKKLLDSFRHMLPSCPCIVLPAEADVRSMARNSPFVLLAILAVTSCSSSLQGHSLYDEEFRKILGLKFVSGSERSLELLQGLLIYCCWYPFHLRPKSRQMVQYLRMAVDLVHDLELDEETSLDLVSHSPKEREAKIQGIRAHSWVWSKPYGLKYTVWMSDCCDALEQQSDLEQDHVLAWLIRMQYILNEIEESQRNRRPDADEQSIHHRQLIRLGLESRLRDFQTRIPGHLSNTPSIVIVSLTADAYLLAAPLMRTPSSQTPEEMATAAVGHVAAAQLQRAAHTTRALLNFMASLPPAQIGYFCGADMTRFIIGIILGFRLSFPVPACPTYDHAHGRHVLDFGKYLSILTTSDDYDSDGYGNGTSGEDGGAGEEGGGTAAGNDPAAEEAAGGGGDGKETGRKKFDAVTALKVVLKSVRSKFEEKSARLAAATAVEESTRRARMCPMFDGSMDQYIPLWAGQQGVDNDGGASGSMIGTSSLSSSYATSQRSAASAVPSGVAAADVAASSGRGGAAAGMGGAGGVPPPLQFHDMWTTMTMGWAMDMSQGLDAGADVADIENVEGFGYLGLDGV